MPELQMDRTLLEFKGPIPKTKVVKKKLACINTQVKAAHKCLYGLTVNLLHTFILSLASSKTGHPLTFNTKAMATALPKVSLQDTMGETGVRMAVLGYDLQ